MIEEQIKTKKRGRPRNKEKTILFARRLTKEEVTLLTFWLGVARKGEIDINDFIGEEKVK